MSRLTLSMAKGQSLIIPVEPLSPVSFAPFGTVVVSPYASDLHSVPKRPKTSSTTSNSDNDFEIPEPRYKGHQPKAVVANQGTALKTSPISPLTQNYPESKDGQDQRGKVEGRMSLFSCFPRQITTSQHSSKSIVSGQKRNVLEINILERHPHTTQTFCPLALSPTDNSIGSIFDLQSLSKFLVIVAPNDDTTDFKLPALNQIRAFVSTCPPSQAVTYGPGTWHAPMIVLGPHRVDFLVTQFVNGISEDDCQEVDILGDNVSVDLSGIDLRKDTVGKPRL